MGKVDVHERIKDGQMVVNVVERMEMAVVKTFFQKRQEWT